MSNPDADLLTFNRLTVVGLGLIGGSLAMAARERFPDWRIQGVDPHAEALQYALKHGAVDEVSLTLPQAWESRDNGQLVVLACHITPALSVLGQLAPLVKGKNILVTDIGSCKQEITSLGRELLPDQFIAGHPMAGKEFSGVQNATSLLFAGKSYLLCPHAETPAARLEQLSQFIKALGANPRLIDAEKHDRYMAYVSHLPQLYSVLLSNLLYRHDPSHLVGYHGAGLDDQIRLSASPHSMWGDVLLHNADNMTQVLTEMRDLINEILPQLSQSGALEPWFKHANEIHQQFHMKRSAL
jgi:prephenate dehydrogenase